MFRPAFAIFAQQYLSVLLDDFGTVFLNEPIPRNPNLRVYKHPSRFNWGTEFLTAISDGNNRLMVSPEVIGEAELVDVLFEPNLEKLKYLRTSLGLLGEIVSSPCIIENLRWAPNEWDLQTFMRHWLTWEAEAHSSIVPVDENSRDTPQESSGDRAEDESKTLIIIVPSIVPKYLQGFGASPSVINIPGVYELPAAFCTTIVVTSELPVNTSTLWLRLLGRGPTQRAAIVELLALDTNNPHRTATLQQLQQWYRLLSDGQMGKESIRLIEILAMVSC
jgi:hypothetical protein